ncbi:testis-specific zinc finger protein topi isoform X1 [Drosophila virilis]|uniref:testis-specific zinc finger protein topi isoform X1 n=1 Tax=Drosophila virilis TaxID=7244 RepID=UPI001395E43E|nr:testis-specific zinc finger protein topi isoform X1 [Drosophila virilis]
MDQNMELFVNGEFLMAEFEFDGNLVVNSDELQPGATVLVSNETDGIVSHEDLAKFFEMQAGVQIPTEEAVERTLADPALKQILQEADGKVDFDPEAEQEKLREFLSGVNNKKMVAENAVPSEVAQKQLPAPSQPRPVLPQSNAFRFIKCSNCNGLFDTPSFQDHSCEYESEQKPMSSNRVLPSQEKKASSPTKKTPSERIIVENQVRIRRYMKDELKYDLETGFDNSKTRKTSTKGPNECTICERKFVHTSGLVRHMEKHALDLIPTQASVQQHHAAPSAMGLLVVLKCNHCGRIFYDVKLALEHIFVHQSTTEPAEPEAVNADEVVLKQQLEQLLLEGEQLLTLTAELERMNGEEYFTTLVLGNVLQCEFCDFIFADVSFLLFHSATHVPERRFECTACDLRMTTAKEASVHYQTDCVYMREGLKQLQAQPNRYFVCNVCELKFANVELLQEHRYSCYHYFPRLSESGKRLVLPCEFCATNFEYAHEIQPHYEEKHLNKKKREKELRNSGNAATMGRLRQYLCDICGKSYTQSSHLWQHLRFHQGVKPFVCQEENCGRKFTIRPDLNDHIRKCHTGERPYHCLVCGKRFLTGSVFYQHRLIHRGERRYECDECGKRFYRADALKNHQRIHTGEKPYDCPFCTKTFRQRGDRDKHVRARHSHLDANARLMMQMQKFELETAAALKAKQMQDGGVEFLVESASAPSVHSPASPMAHDQQFDMVELDPSDFGEGSEFVQHMPMPINTDDQEIMSYVDLEGAEAIEQQPFQLENNENVKVVVVENNTSQPFYF